MCNGNYRLIFTAALGSLLFLAASTLADEPKPSPPIERLSEEACRAASRVFDYDAKIPLESRIVEKKTDEDGYVREKVVFRGAAGELVPGYLQLPQTEAEQHPCVLLLHGWSGAKDRWFVDGGYMSGGQVRKALLAAGYAIFALDAQCHGDRIAVNDYAPVNHYEAEGPQPRKGYLMLPEIYAQTVKDYRRGIDYLASRGDIDVERIGMVGYSMGGTQTFLLTGVEPRIKVAVACVVPAERDKYSLVAPQNQTYGIGDRPLLMIMGRSDTMCPVDHAQQLRAMLPAKTSELIFIDAGHKLSLDYVPHAVRWVTERL
ncbi:alpha/beta hydrolase family protein [Symmachiella dynata]|uniref:alpha/beta hydrolase family protein n=1 Tax=Symmachiella dynata TaxID=2527995 RepID=UPI0030EDE526